MRLLTQLLIVLLAGFLLFVVGISVYKNYFESDVESSATSMMQSKDQVSAVSMTVDTEIISQLCAERISKIQSASRESVCTATLDVIARALSKAGLTLEGFYQLDMGECSEVFDQQEEIDSCRLESLETTRSVLTGEAMVLALCGFDNAWIESDQYSAMTNRAGNVYTGQTLAVDCELGQHISPNYEQLFPMAEERDLLIEIEPIYSLLGTDKESQIPSLISQHNFGSDPLLDKTLMEFFLEDRYLPLLQQVLALNANTHTYEADYYNQPLGIALENKSPKAALALLNAGASPIHPFDFGEVPIVLAARAGLLDVVKLLIDKGADVDAVIGSESGGFAEALSGAVYYGHTAVVDFLLSQGAKLQPDNPANYPEWDNTRLSVNAVHGGVISTLERFLKLGFGLPNERIVIDNALKSRNPAMMSFIFQQGVELKPSEDHDGLFSDLEEIISEQGHVIEKKI